MYALWVRPVVHVVEVEAAVSLQLVDRRRHVAELPLGHGSVGCVVGLPGHRHAACCLDRVGYRHAHVVQAQSHDSQARPQAQGYARVHPSGVVALVLVSSQDDRSGEHSDVSDSYGSCPS